MRPKRREGQAAMEFLMTYGWAILAVLVMIGALSYFGIINPQKYFPDGCLMGAGFSCKDYQVTTTSNGLLTTQFTLGNEIGDNINIIAANATSPLDGTTSGNCTMNPPSRPFMIDSTAGFICNFTSTATRVPGNGQPIKLRIDITYIPVTGQYPRTVSGEIRTKMQ